MPSTRSSGTGPSKPQPKADCTETCTFFPAATACFAAPTMRCVASSVPMPVFLRLWVSLAETPMQNISTPQASPRSSPFSFSTRPESAVADVLPAVSRRNSSSVSAICGTFSGWTNEPTWTMSTPAVHRAADPALPSVSSGTTCFSICSPSRGPTSWMTMRVMVSSAAPTASPRWPAPSPGSSPCRPCRRCGPCPRATTSATAFSIRAPASASRRASRASSWRRGSWRSG